MTSAEQAADAAALRRSLAAAARIQDLVEVGAYAPGADPVADAALACQAQIEAFLAQPADEIAAADASWAQLSELVARLRAHQGASTAVAS